MSLKDKKIHIRNKKDNDIKNYCFEGIDVKEAVLEFENYLNQKIIIRENQENGYDSKIEKIDLNTFKEIFGDFKNGR